MFDDRLLETLSGLGLERLELLGRAAMTLDGLQHFCAALAPSLMDLTWGVHLDVEHRVVLVRALPALRRVVFKDGVLEALVAMEDAGATSIEVLCEEGDASTEGVAALVRVCPALRRVALHDAKPGAVPLLAGLPLLSDLSLRRFSIVELLELLQVVGPRLVKLELVEESEDRMVSLDQLAALCPALEHLSVDTTSIGVAAAMALPSLHTFRVTASDDLPASVLFDLVSNPAQGSEFLREH